MRARQGLGGGGVRARAPGTTAQHTLPLQLAPVLRPILAAPIARSRPQPRPHHLSCNASTPSGDGVGSVPTPCRPRRSPPRAPAPRLAARRPDTPLLRCLCGRVGGARNRDGLASGGKGPPPLVAARVCASHPLPPTSLPLHSLLLRPPERTNTSPTHNLCPPPPACAHTQPRRTPPPLPAQAAPP